MPTTERSSIEGPTLQRSPPTSRMGFASLVYPMSMVWASSLVRTSNTAVSLLLLPHNKSLHASRDCVSLKMLYQFIVAAIARPRELNRWATHHECTWSTAVVRYSDTHRCSV